MNHNNNSGKKAGEDRNHSQSPAQQQEPSTDSENTNQYQAAPQIPFAGLVQPPQLQQHLPRLGATPTEASFMAAMNQLNQTASTYAQVAQLSLQVLYSLSSSPSVQQQYIDQLQLQLTVSEALGHYRQGLIVDIQRLASQIIQERSAGRSTHPVTIHHPYNNNNNNNNIAAFAALPQTGMTRGTHAQLPASPPTVSALPNAHATTGRAVINNKNNNAQDTAKTATSMANKNSIPFPVKLYLILDESDKYDDIICWTPDGTAFTIRDQRRFMEELAPSNFRCKSYDSFVRQLHFYRFQKIDWGSMFGTYQHEHLRRGHPELAWKIKRKKREQKGDEETEADEKDDDAEA